MRRELITPPWPKLTPAGFSGRQTGAAEQEDQRVVLRVIDRQTAPETQYHSYVLEGGQNYREILLGLPETGTEDFKSTHWDQPNVIAHIRLNDRYDADGGRILFVEEIQSDWGQEGKEKSFVGRQMQKTIDDLTRGLSPKDLIGLPIVPTLARLFTESWNEKFRPPFDPMIFTFE